MQFIKDGTPELGPVYLEPTEFFDFDVEAVRDFAYESIGDEDDATAKAIKLYYAVRDSIRYDPYRIELSRDLFKASNLLAIGSGFCLPKANLLIAAARAVGIPAAIGLSDVRNHLCTERLRRIMGGKELFLHHGYAVLYLDGTWVKAAPAFNIELCNRFDVLPTEFDGTENALFQQFDAKGRRHMEYVTDHGIWSDFPFDRIARDFSDYYPKSFFENAARDDVNRKFEEERSLA
jgi:transglutaminase-like putative cysteine protease